MTLGGLPRNDSKRQGGKDLRRTFLKSILLGATVLVLAACSTAQQSNATDTPRPTVTLPGSSPIPPTQSPQATQTAMACVNGKTTPSQTEGPYFKSGSPERKSLLEAGMGGTKLSLDGQVFTRNCKPVKDAVLDFWQADDRGQYDNSGYRLRGHQSTDAEGRYHLATALPGLYPGRTRHIHLKVTAPNGPVLTTQLYFSGEAQNSTDSIFDQGLAIILQDAADGKKAVFNFVLDVN